MRVNRTDREVGQRVSLTSAAVALLLNEAEFAAWRGVLIARNAVAVLRDGRVAARLPFTVALRRCGFSASSAASGTVLT